TKGENITAEIRLKYLLVEVCTVQHENVVRKQLRAKFLDSSSSMSSLCSNDDCGNVHVTAACDGPSSHTVATLVELNDLPGTVTDESSSGVTMTTQDVLRAATTKADFFDLPLAGAQLQRDSIVFNVELTCLEGYTIYGDICEPTKTTTEAASPISAELVGTIVGGCIGVVALIVLAIIVVKFLRKGERSAKSRYDHPFNSSSPEHGYSSLSTLASSKGYRGNPSYAMSSLDTSRTWRDDENNYDYLDDVINDSGISGMPSSFTCTPPSGGQLNTSPPSHSHELTYLTPALPLDDVINDSGISGMPSSFTCTPPSGGQLNTSPPSHSPELTYLTPALPLAGFTSKVPKRPEVPAKLVKSPEPCKPQSKTTPAVLPKPKPILPGIEARDPQKFIKDQSLSQGYVPNPTLHVKNSKYGYKMPAADDTQSGDVSNKEDDPRLWQPMQLSPHDLYFQMKGGENMSHDTKDAHPGKDDYYIPPADYES
ncbi:hypothetical protein BaRGS_00015064, partial [Batillaria attramentaria]